MKKLLYISFVFLFGSTVISNAQKLPTEQEVSLRAPAGLKTDGKATEWNNTFQAFNNHVEFFYTMANDDQSLYLTIQPKQPEIIRHIINGGITLTINPSGSKKDKNGIHITYPLIGALFLPLKNTRLRYAGAPPVTEGDSVMNATNKRMDDKSKEIRVTGIKNIDTLISVYNTNGIKAAAAFDNKMVYTYELAVSLKNLGMSAQASSKFIYQLRINDVESRGIEIKRDDAGKMLSVNITGPNAVAGQAATDFWGEYTLAK
jgi:hypothetical protein